AGSRADAQAGDGGRGCGGRRVPRLRRRGVHHRALPRRRRRAHDQVAGLMTQLLGLDLGMTSFKAVVYDEHGAVVAAARVAPPDEATTIDGLRVDFWRADALWD